MNTSNENLLIEPSEVKDLVELVYCNVTDSEGYISVNSFDQIYTLTDGKYCEYNGFLEDDLIYFEFDERYQMRTLIPDPSADSFLKYQNPRYIFEKKKLKIFAKTNLKFEFHNGYEFFMVNEESSLDVRIQNDYSLKYCNSCDCHLITKQTELVNQISKKGFEKFNLNLVKKDNSISII